MLAESVDGGKRTLRRRGTMPIIWSADIIPIRWHSPGRVSHTVHVCYEDFGHSVSFKI